jgi:hypothetical protein
MSTFIELHEAHRRQLVVYSKDPKAMAHWSLQSLGHAIRMGLDLTAQMRPGRLPEGCCRVFDLSVDDRDLDVDYVIEDDGEISVMAVWANGVEILDWLTESVVETIADKVEDRLAADRDAALVEDAETDVLFGQP